MRPVRLELEGFTAFRERVEIDLADAELFALTGPTGSGKTSVLDALLFALYGSVPRLGRRDVAPVVTQGRLQARVRLDFTVAGVPYTAVRVVRKGPRGGANTDEARLESDGEVLASGANEVTEAVQRLLGLSFEQFTTCVVLPQGEFARFLHEQPSARQDLLVALLDLGIYEQVRGRASLVQQLAEARIGEIDGQLAGLEGINRAALAAAEQRVATLQELFAHVEEALPALNQLLEAGTAAQGAATAVADQLTRLRALKPPPGMAGLVEEVTQGRTALEEARRRLDECRQQVEAAEKRRAELGDRVELERTLGLFQQLGDERTRLAAAMVEAEQELAAAAAARQRLEEATQRLEQARRQHAAAHLRVGLAPGEDCPVCGQEVRQLPEASHTPELSQAEQAHQQAAHDNQTAQQAAASATARREELARRVAALEETLEDSPGEEAIRAELAAIVEAEAVLDAARKNSGHADQQLRRCERRLEELSEAVRKARRQLQEARDTVAGLGPPALELEELAADWQRLLDWAAAILPQLEEQAAEAASQVEELRARYQSAQSELQERCRQAGVEVAGRPLRDAVYEALSDAGNAHRRVLEQLQQVEDLQAERQRRAEEATLARDLARHLGAANFEKWVLEEALRLLVAGANERLGDLARGHYSLALDSRLQFEVIDHFAADERRPVKTLSGGETFLVSLALALSLADRVAELSAQGSARLESIFLDEGFGTLDPEALETVASVVTEIGASGKTVGIVTHVKELAELMPVRFEVTKGAGGAAVTRMDQ